MLSSKVLQVVFILYYCFISTKSDSELGCRQIVVMKSIYTSLHDAITKHFVEKPNAQHVDLLPIGQVLDYEEFNPGKKTKFGPPGTLPLNVIENALPLVDKLFPTGATVNPASVNHSQSDENYHFDSLSSTFEFILTHMMVKARNFSSEEKLRAKYYLQELVPNPELVIQNATELPRFLLYDYYRNLYLKEKETKENELDVHRQTLTKEDFENWGVQKLPTLESESDAAYQKWMIFGYKNEVEQELQYFDINSHEDKLVSTHALFKSMAIYSQKDPHVKVYPFMFEPDTWYLSLTSSLPESSDELRYQMSLLKAKQALLNATQINLANKTDEDVSNSLSQIKNIMNKLRLKVKSAVDKLLQMEIDCFAKVNLTVCGNIVSTHTAFRLLLNDVAEHYEQAAYLESILNRQEDTLLVLRQKLNDITEHITNLDKRISQARDIETSNLVDLSIDRSSLDSSSSATCMEAGKIEFTYLSSEAVIDTSQCSRDLDKKYCADVRVPLNATQSRLWSVRSCSVDHELKAFDDVLADFHQEMNAKDVEIKASLHKVNIKRPWLDENIFEDSDHFTMKRNRGIVSPGHLSPLNYFHQVAESGRYLMPQFTSSMILATNISLFFPGLGSWRNEQNDIDNHTNAIINLLMKYGYALNLEGGYGPFSLAPKGGSRKLNHNFRVERKSGGVLIQVPGAQLIGFISSVVPKFPKDQGPLPKKIDCISEERQNNQRQKRSSSDDIMIDNPKKIRKLSNELFNSGIIEKLNSHSETNVYSSTKSLERLLKDVDNTQSKVDMFLDRIHNQETITGDNILSDNSV